MKKVIICIMISFIYPAAYASHGKKEEPKKEGHGSKPEAKKTEEHKPEEKKKEEKKPLEPKAVRDLKDQQAKVKTLKTYIKMDEAEIAKCKKKDLSQEEKISCPRNVDYYKARIEQNQLKLKEAELGLRSRERDAKKYIKKEEGSSGHSGH